MSRIVAIGCATDLAGYALAGVEVVDASTPQSVQRAWAELGPDVGLVLLTADAFRALPGPLERQDLLWEVLPA